MTSQRQCFNFLSIFVWSILCFSVSVFAQYTTSTLGVTIVDPSGAAVSDAKITVHNLGTGMERVATSSSNGGFTFTALPVGNYAVTVEKTGFSRFNRTGITLTVDQPVNIPVKLQIGNVTEQVNVSGDAELVNTESGTVGQLINTKKIVDLPLDGRQPQALLFLAAGTINTTGNYCLVNCQGGVYPGEQDANVNGGGSRGVNYQMDGGGHNDTYLNANLPFPNPDAIQEFNVETDNVSAQYGIGAGAVVNLVTKSGTNELHGDLFEFVRNGYFNARNFFAPTSDTLKRNQFGGSVGGPIVKNKLFYFGTYQGTRIRSAAQGNIAFVPTPAERTGNFAGSGITVVDPNTGVQFPSNQIPASRLSAPAQYLLQHIPEPNGPNGQLTYPGANIVQNDNQYLIKLNWIAGKNQLSGSWFRTRFYEPPDLAIGRQNIIAADGNGNQVTVKKLAVNDTFSLSQNVLFNTWFSWNSQTGGSLSGAPFGFPDAGINVAAPTPPEVSLSVNGFFGVQTSHLGQFDRGDYSFREDVTIVRGSHEIHIGGEALHVSNNLVNTFNMSGGFTFGNALSGSNLSDFLLGAASNFIQGGGEYKDLRGVLWSFYGQDNIRITPNFKLQVGLRWDPYFPYTEQKGRVVCYMPGSNTTSQRFPNAPPWMLFGGDQGCPKGGSEANILNLAPRLGFSYKIGANMVLRGGAGIYYTPPGNHDSNGMVDTAPFSPQFNYTGIINFADPFASVGIPNPFPAQYAANAPPSNVAFTLPVSIYGTLQHNWHMPELVTWNLNLERQFGQSWVARISYAGNKGTHLASGVLSFNEQNPAIYNPAESVAENLATTQQRRINPVFGSVGLFSSDNNSHYQSLRINIEKRLSRGLSLLANYTHSRLRDDLSANGGNGRTNPFNRSFDNGISNDDVPNVFNFSALWRFPSAPLHGISAKLINGWELTAITNWRSGFPYSVFSSIDNSLSGIGSDRADQIGGTAGLDPNRPHSALIQEYFNVAAFVPNAIGTFGNSGKNMLRGPRYFDTDLGLLRNFAITERFSLQFRAEFFNAFNNVNFGLPHNYLGSSSTGQITSAGNPRILQFALKLRF
jgi:carboxypeptidase family protein/TonB-dependent receptor-like protein